MRLLILLRMSLFALVACGSILLGVQMNRSASDPEVAAAALPFPASMRQESFSSDLIPEVAERVTPAVVSIYTTRSTPRGPFALDPFGLFDQAPGPEQGLGSGVIVKTDGVILTNNHVVEHALELRVVLSDRRELKAKVVGRDPHTDLAVLRIDAKNLPSLPFGDSAKVRVGDIVLAIGNSMGVGQTVSCGIVSAKGRANMGIVDYEDFLQTDAAINPGNSGGPLINLKGEIIGLNTAIATRTGGFQGIGFAIPSRMIREVLEILLKEGKVNRGQMGILIQDLTPALTRAFEKPPERGVIVTEVLEKSAGEEAGLRRGDIIVGLDGRPIESTADLRNRVALRGGGTEVKIQVWRDGKTRDVAVRLKEQEETIARAKPEDSGGTDETGAPSGLEGVTVMPATGDLLKRFGIVEEKSGLFVTSVSPAAAFSGLRRGDLIVEVNRTDVATVAEMREAVRKSRDPVLLRVRRSEGALYIAVPK